MRATLGMSRELDRRYLLSPANHGDSYGLARSLALSLSRVAAARGCCAKNPGPSPRLPAEVGFLLRARQARWND